VKGIGTLWIGSNQDYTEKICSAHTLDPPREAIFTNCSFPALPLINGAGQIADMLPQVR